MEVLNNGFTLETPAGTFPLSTDSILLSDFVKLPANAKVLDLGSGCGTLGILLCSQDAHCQMTGIELDPIAHEAALNNIAANGLESRMSSKCSDLRCIPKEHYGLYDCCVSNPPYFTGGPVSRNTPAARRDDYCNLNELFGSASRALKYGGDFFLVHKPERLAEICACATQHHLEPKRLRLIRHRPQEPVSLILLSCRKGGKPGLIWEDRCLFDMLEQPTEYYRTLYHL